MIICESDQDALIIRWLYVAPDKRGQGYGDALLSAALDAALSVGKNTVAAMFGPEPERDTICPDEREYFEYHGFDREELIGDYDDPMMVMDINKNINEI
ncbi:MAG: GNAT family N-acetyltransferase [Lachnospiraceae bacterium]|nr:GNAT family N-acetyltransferase [Lachnospiraceae bacterium]